MITDTDQFTDLEIFAKTLDGEAGDQGYLGQQAVANVIMNRVRLQWQRETTVRGVCLHHAQFSCWSPGADRDRIMMALEPQCLEIAQRALDDTLPDITGGADSYEVRGTGAYWAKNLTPAAAIGAHDFYITA